MAVVIMLSNKHVGCWEGWSMSRAASIWHSIWRVSRFCRSLKVTISVPCLHGYLCYYREASRELLAYGYSYIGKDLLYSGTSGDLLRAFVFMGPVFYQKLKHMVMDKMHSRAYLPCVFVKLSPLNINRTPQARFYSELYIVYCACKYTVLNPCSYVYLGPRAQCVCAVLFNVLHDSLFDLGSRASPPKGNNTALRMALIFGT